MNANREEKDSISVDKVREEVDERSVRVANCGYAKVRREERETDGVIDVGT